MLFCAVKEYNMFNSKFFTYIFIAAVIAACLVSGCAKRGVITGGPKDSIPPIMISSSPKNMSTNFTGNEIRINFDEYIKIKDINKQLIISPPMETQPAIIPMGSASKYISIKIKDTLKPNTTYSFNFGQSITDNNEGNPYSQFKFIFSTGPYVDSLTVVGRIKDAYSGKTDNFVNVMLYEANETFNDSTIYKEKPRYVTNTLDSMVNYSLENLKEGRYYIVALKEKSSNYKFDPGYDKIAFLKDPITIPTDTVYQLTLFKEQRPFKALKPSQASSNRYFAGYEGDYRGVTVDVKNAATNEAISTVATKVPEKDSLQIWTPRNIKTVADSLIVSVKKNDSIKEFIVKTKEMKAADSLAIDAVQKGTLHFRDKFAIKASTPVVAIDSTKMSIINKDSVAVPFKTAYNILEQKLEFDFEKEEDQKYELTLLPGALKDFYEKENDTLSFKFSTRLYNDYGNLRVTLQNARSFPLILEVLNEKEDIIATYYSEGETYITFDNLEPNNFLLRVIYDDNKNKEWDSGNYLEKRQPEEVIYLPKPVMVKPFWDVEETFNLGG